MVEDAIGVASSNGELAAFLQQLAEKDEHLGDRARERLAEAAQRLMESGAGATAGAKLPKTLEELLEFLGRHYQAMRLGEDEQFWLSSKDLLKAMRAHEGRHALGAAAA